MLYSVCDLLWRPDCIGSTPEEDVEHSSATSRASSGVITSHSCAKDPRPGHALRQSALKGVKSLWNWARASRQLTRVEEFKQNNSLTRVEEIPLVRFD